MTRPFPPLIPGLRASDLRATLAAGALILAGWGLPAAAQTTMPPATPPAADAGAADAGADAGAGAVQGAGQVAGQGFVQDGATPDATAPDGGISAETACPANDTQAEAATQPDASADATAPENTGATGWSGGTGGSVLGTNTQGAVDSSPTWQPPTARGLDLAGLAEPAARC